MSLTSKQLAALQEAGKDKIFQLPERRRHSPGVLAALVRAGLLQATSVGVIWNITAAGRDELARGQKGAGNEKSATKLTEAQKRVMGWIGKGWRTAPGPGSAVMVNGKRICNTDTMMALHRAGLVSKDDRGCWSATESGKKLTVELRL